MSSSVNSTANWKPAQPTESSLPSAESFSAAADQIDRARTLIPTQSATNTFGHRWGRRFEAWRTLDEHIRIVDVIGTRIPSAFAPRLGAFPQVTEFTLADGSKLEDRALMACAGDLETDSSFFRKPGSHRNSPWCQTGCG